MRAYEAKASLDAWVAAAIAEPAVVRGHARRWVEAWAASLRAAGAHEKAISTSEAAAGGPPRSAQPALSKASVYDVSTFKAEAPELPKLVKDLFCFRDEELARALDVLRANLDLNGERAALRDRTSGRG